jgi:hypothetical protein
MRPRPLLLLLVAFAPLAAAAGVVHVAPDGDDAWPGALARPNDDGSDGPLATLEAARDAVRRARAAGVGGEVTVLVQGGDYVRQATFELTAEDGGTAEAPVMYRAADGAAPRLLGGAVVMDFAKLTDPAVLERLAPEARDHVVVADLAGMGITDYGTIKRRGFGLPGVPMALELYFNGKPMTLARWPNDEWTTIASVPENSEGVFLYDGDRPDRWASLEDIWVHGYWTWDWAESYEKIAEIDRESKHITTVPPHGVYGYKAGKRFYFLNVLEELDTPGEYYVDRATGILYFWPPAPVESGEAAVSMLETPFITMTDTSHVSIEGLTFMYTRGPGLQMSGGAHNTIRGCTFANLGTSAVSVSGGTRHTVQGCEMYNLNYGGISLSGGDRNTLTPARHRALNNHIHHFSLVSRTYTPAVQVNGVGNRVANNLIHDAPHMAIGLGGNDHVIELNEIHHVCMETSDAGAFYMGRDWTQRGNIIRYNFFHQLGHGDVQAIYLDDWTSGTTVFGNICHGALRGVLVGGGRDNFIENNIFVDCKIGVHIDQRGLGWAKYYFDGTTTTLFDRLEAVNGTAPPYTDRYPELATLLDDEPALAKNNVVVRNIFVGGKAIDLRDGLTPDTPHLTIQDNVVDIDPGFAAPESLDFRLDPASPAYEYSFQPIPWQQIGPR